MSTGCIGARLGYRSVYSPDAAAAAAKAAAMDKAGSDGAESGLYGGLFVDVVTPDWAINTRAKTGGAVSNILPGAELAYTFAPGSGYATVMPMGIARVDGLTTDFTLTLGLGIEFGEQTAVEAAFCGGSANIMSGFGCGRWSSLGWVGADLSLGLWIDGVDKLRN